MKNDYQEILTILQEECAEVIVGISKCFRFGPDQILKGQDLTNLQQLQQEIGDVKAMVELLVDLNIGVSNQGIDEAKQNKFKKLKQFSNINFNK
jgi:NTP pyrophosphatase (non-canonical NTP hydrolase)